MLCCCNLNSRGWDSPVTTDTPDVVRTPHVKSPECLCHVKYASELSKQCIQYSQRRKLCSTGIFVGSAIDRIHFLGISHSWCPRKVRKCNVQVHSVIISLVTIGVFVVHHVWIQCDTSRALLKQISWLEWTSSRLNSINPVLQNAGKQVPP